MKKASTLITGLVNRSAYKGNNKLLNIFHEVGVYFHSNLLFSALELMEEDETTVSNSYCHCILVCYSTATVDHFPLQI